MAAYGAENFDADAGSQISGAPIAADASNFAGFGYPAAFGGFGYPTAIGGFGAPVTGFAGPVQYGAPITTQFAAPVQYAPLPVRRPGYNERLVAWRNRQKAFNRYKKQTKLAIKNAARAQTHAAHYAFGPAATTFVQPQATFIGQPTYFGGFEQQFAYPTAFGSFAYGAAPAAASFAGDFNSYSEASQAQQEAQAVEEPEIRGTQV